MSKLCAKRPAIVSDETIFDQDFRSARWVKHRLLDFEDAFQKHLNDVSEEVAPGLVRCGRILARLSKREDRAKHTSKGRWKPRPRPELKAHCETEKTRLREVRNADPRWQEALGWADAIGQETSEKDPPRRKKGKDPSKVVKRKKESEAAFRKRFEKLTRDETDEEFEERKAKRQNYRGRREHHRYVHYSQRRCHYDTWNALLASVDQAVAAVIDRRAQGLPAGWNRPKRGSAQGFEHFDTTPSPQSCLTPRITLLTLHELQMNPETQREHFRAVLSSISTALRFEQNETALSKVQRALETFDETYCETPRIVKMVASEYVLGVLLDNGELWTLSKGTWTKLPLPPPMMKEKEP